MKIFLLAAVAFYGQGRGRQSTFNGPGPVERGLGPDLIQTIVEIRKHGLGEGGNSARRGPCFSQAENML